jgi:hypothetical protein
MGPIRYNVPLHIAGKARWLQTLWFNEPFCKLQRKFNFVNNASRATFTTPDCFINYEWTQKA